MLFKSTVKQPQLLCPRGMMHCPHTVGENHWLAMQLLNTSPRAAGAAAKQHRKCSHLNPQIFQDLQWLSNSPSSSGFFGLAWVSSMRNFVQKEFMQVLPFTFPGAPWWRSYPVLHTTHCQSTAITLCLAPMIWDGLKGCFEASQAALKDTY